MSDFNIQAKGLFGRYCRIEMFRYGVPNEFYLHKIVSQSRQNTYCDVPLKWDSKPEKHEAKEGVFPDNLEEVIWVVQCGLDETHVFPVALKDVELLGEDFNEERDVCSYEEGYADGFDRGEEAIIQQVDGIVSDEWKIQKDMVKAIKSLIKEFWKEREA